MDISKLTSISNSSNPGHQHWAGVLCGGRCAHWKLNVASCSLCLLSCNRLLQPGLLFDIHRLCLDDLSGSFSVKIFTRITQFSRRVVKFVIDSIDLTGVHYLTDGLEAVASNNHILMLKLQLVNLLKQIIRSGFKLLNV